MTVFESSFYALLGGEAGLRSLVDRFYDLMESSPEAEKIRAFHPKSLKQSLEKLFMFLAGWSGAHNYMWSGLVIRAFACGPFPIGTVKRDQWLWCMNKALVRHYPNDKPEKA